MERMSFVEKINVNVFQSPNFHIAASSEHINFIADWIISFGILPFPAPFSITILQNADWMKVMENRSLSFFRNFLVAVPTDRKS